MKIREATRDDGAAIRSIALRSMEASYSLSPAAIEGAIRQWYDEESFAERLDDDDVVLLVVELDGEEVAFSESVLVDDRGDIHWLHVAAMFRGEGIGDRLFDETKAALEDAGAETIRGLVLADNADGNAFYERRGLQKIDEHTVEIDGTTYIENVYVDEDATRITELTTPDGRELYVDESDSDRGSKAGFYTVYTDENRENKYGYYCGSCGTLVTSMDSMGAMECSDCGNRLKPTRWDAAYM